MPKSLKISLYLFLFGLLTFLGAWFRNPQQREYSVAEVLGAKTGVQLFIEPDDGRQKIIDVINLAQKEILIEVYLFSDSEVIAALKEAEGRGVRVQAILEQHPFGGSGLNPATKVELESFGAEVNWSSPSFTLTHEKSIIVDGRIVCVLNMNLSKTAFEKNREYNACAENPTEVSDARQIFLADWDRKGFISTAANLVVSPENSRGKLTALIKSATRSLDVEMEVLEDPRIIDLLAQKATQVPVRVILPPLSRVDANKMAINKLKTKVLRSPYVHAKLIIADKQRVYLGSVNLSSQSLDRNRELGLLISQPDIVERINQTFENDWEMAE